ncbi:MAG TPA: cation diffusion facilitator family transporter [Candidatus Sulfotelmatobacter sp.]|nr:cation diffusion facilitator family transporter [Candidatus Sulfotelmatobacter sp.]
MSDTQHHNKQGVALSSVFASAFMALTKLVVGLLTGSLGILSEAAHSLLDLGAAVLTYFAVRVSDQPADERHPYGHGKIESVSALIETGLLFLTGAWIIREAVLRLLSTDSQVEIKWYSVAVILMSIVIDFTRSRALMKVAKATKSLALEADALHFSSDILSSAVVLVGLGCVAIGYPKGDAVAAIGVSLFVFHVGWDMGRRTIDVLLDAAPEGIAEKVETVAAAVPGVARVVHVRARPAGSTVFVEVLINVSRLLPLDDAQQVCDAVADAVRKRLPEAQALVKAEPLALDSESIADTVRLVATRQGILIHDLGVVQLNGRPHVSFDIEVDEEMDIQSAHAIANGIEHALRQELGEDLHIDTHIDPRRFGITQGQQLTQDLYAVLAAQVEAIARQIPNIRDVHHIHFQEAAHGLYVSLHCLFPATTPVRIVHDATVTVETRIRHALPEVGRVVVHAEPLGHHEGDEGLSH